MIENATALTTETRHFCTVNHLETAGVRFVYSDRSDLFFRRHNFRFAGRKRWIGLSTPFVSSWPLEPKRRNRRSRYVINEPIVGLTLPGVAQRARWDQCPRTGEKVRQRTKTAQTCKSELAEEPADHAYCALSWRPGFPYLEADELPSAPRHDYLMGP